MNTHTYGTAWPGVLERFIKMRTPKDSWLFRVERYLELTTASVLSAEQREYAAHYYDEQVACGNNPSVYAVVSVIINGIPPFVYIRR